MTEARGMAGAGLRLARQARGLSQRQLAAMAGVTRQALSAVESGQSDPSLRVALALARALGETVEELFGPAALPEPVTATPVADVSAGARVTLAAVGDRFVAIPPRGTAGFAPAGGLVLDVPGLDVPGLDVPGPDVPGPDVRGPDLAGRGLAGRGGVVLVRPVVPPRPTLVVAGCDPALPLLAPPLSLLDPPVGFAWWPCGSGEAVRLAAAGLVHVAGVHPGGDRDAQRRIPGGAEAIGFASWREGLVSRPDTPVLGAADLVAGGRRLVNREPGAQARALLDAELYRLGIPAAEVAGYQATATGHLEVAAAVAGGLADAGVASEPAALEYGLRFVPLGSERFELLLPGRLAATREVSALRRVLSSPWLPAQLAAIPGYAPPG